MHRLHRPELARNYFFAGFGIVAARETSPTLKAAVDKALADPSAENLCAAEMAARGTDWYESILFSIAAIGISAAGIVLGERA